MALRDYAVAVVMGASSGIGFATAQRRNTFPAMQAFQDHAFLLFQRIMPARPATDIPDHLLDRVFLAHGFLPHLRSLRSIR